MKIVYFKQKMTTFLSHRIKYVHNKYCVTLRMWENQCTHIGKTCLLRSINGNVERKSFYSLTILWIFGTTAVISSETSFRMFWSFTVFKPVLSQILILCRGRT